MIRARFINKGGSIRSFEVSGHAGYADDGSDIVCASVSSAVQMAVNTITEVIGLAAEVNSDGNLIRLRLPKSDSGNKTAAAQAVINGLRLHLSILSEQYEETISIEDSEV
jgi:uncharacterized protein YsxB (DUF464 family)